MTRAEQLNTAQANKKDEFYTQLCDIEAELKHYIPHFKGKVVYCNCDDPLTSNFALFFKQNFKSLNLKGLICSCYKCREQSLFDNDIKSFAFYMEYDGTEKTDKVMALKGDGDFRSKECLQLLDKADIVVTNPPFSLFRDFIRLLAAKEKKFIIIGNVNAISYKECFSLIQAEKMWLGSSIHSGDREFQVPQDYPLQAAGCRIDAAGNRYIRVKGVRWFTNLDYEERHKSIKLIKQYSPECYPKFDNIDAINVGKTKDIPADYSGLMGVPITFLDKYNPQQFKIEGNEYSMNIVGGRCYLKGKRMYSRIFITHRNKTLPKEMALNFNASSVASARI